MPLAACAPDGEDATTAPDAATAMTLPGHVPAIVPTLRAVKPVDPATEVDLVIGVATHDEEGRKALLHDLYDPASPEFQQYLEPEEYAARFNATADEYERVVAFAKQNGLTVVKTVADRKFVQVRASADVIARVFRIGLNQYQHPTENRLFFAPDREPSLGVTLPISHITGLDDLWQVRRAPGSKKAEAPHTAGQGPNGWFTGTDLRAAYAPGVTLTGAGQTVGILETVGYKLSDIQAYEQVNGFPNVPIQNVYIDGYTGSTNNNESTGDIEFVMSMAPGARINIYGTNYTNTGIVDTLHEMANPTKGEVRPNQISTSYYFFYDKNVYDSLAQLAAQGQAFVVASGDWGSYNETSGAGAFPPADHPLVTSVGGTNLTTSGPGGTWVSEETWPESGGGYSPWGADPQFALPWWQVGMNFAAFGGSSGVRNGPDVAMVSNDLAYILDGKWEWFGGTSASAPLFAGFLALANEQAAKAGRPRIGMANPAIYSAGRTSCPTCFHDIATGSNGAYNAVAGFDLCTGFGTPTGQPLIDALVGYGKGWAVLPGGGTTALPDTATVFQNKLYLFGIGTGDHQHYVNKYDGHAWSGWSALPGGGTTVLADTATVFNNRLYLFGIGTGDHQHYVNSFNGSTWSGWSAVPGGGTTSLSDTAAVFNNRLYLFAIGTGDHRHYVSSFDGTSWAGWAQVPGGGTTSLADSAIAYNGKLYLFAIGTGDQKHYVNSFNGSTWSGWAQVPGGGTTALPDATAVVNGMLYVFAIGITDHKHYMNRLVGSSWSGWTEVPGGGTTLLPDAATTFQNKIHLFAIGTNDHQHYMNVLN